eukprot:PhM_4_TR3228/c0_g1_i1/m.67366/K10609/CUL4; cullin 4
MSNDSPRTPQQSTQSSHRHRDPNNRHNNNRDASNTTSKHSTAKNLFDDNDAQDGDSNSGGLGMTPFTATGVAASPLWISTSPAGSAPNRASMPMTAQHTTSNTLNSNNKATGGGLWSSKPMGGIGAKQTGGLFTSRQPTATTGGPNSTKKAPGSMMMMNVTLPTLPSGFETTWRASVRDTLEAILHKRPAKASLESVRRNIVEELIRQSKWEDSLCNDVVREVLVKYIPSKKWSSASCDITEYARAMTELQLNLGFFTTLLCTSSTQVRVMEQMAFTALKQYFETSRRRDDVVECFRGALKTIRESHAHQGAASIPVDVMSSVHSLLATIDCYTHESVYGLILADTREHYGRLAQQANRENIRWYLVDVVNPALELEKRLQASYLVPPPYVPCGDGSDKPKTTYDVVADCLLWALWDDVLTTDEALTRVFEPDTSVDINAEVVTEDDRAAIVASIQPLKIMWNATKHEAHAVDRLRTVWKDFLSRKLTKELLIPPSKQQQQQRPGQDSQQSNTSSAAQTARGPGTSPAIEFIQRLIGFYCYQHDAVLLRVLCEGVTNVSSTHPFMQTFRASWEKSFSVSSTVMDYVSKALANFYDKKYFGVKALPVTPARAGSPDTGAPTAAPQGPLPLLVLLPSKDMFEAYYKVFCARRLLLNPPSAAASSTSTDAGEVEREVASLLRKELGASFIQKIEGMLRDVEGSKELSNEFVTTLESNASTMPTLQVAVLADGHWPSMGLTWEDTNNDALPFHTMMDRFTTFYKKKFSNRVLTWRHTMSTVQLRGKFNSGSHKELVMTMPQALILLTLDGCDGDTLSLKDLCKRVVRDDLKDPEASGASGGGSAAQRCVLGLAQAAAAPQEVQSIVTSLVSAKLVVASNNNSDVTYAVNAAFTHRLVKVRIPPPSSTSAATNTKDSDDAISAGVRQDRTYALDAAVVRFMKSRRRASHQDMLMQVVAMCSRSFPATAQDVKKRIESLIERDYIRRDDTDPSTYHYIS